MFETTQKRSSNKYDTTYITIENNLPNTLVSGTYGIPNQDSKMWITIIDHEYGTRFPVIYEHCDYLGKSYPLGADSVTGIYSLGNIGWNDRISSIRIPPGMRVVLFENDKYGGKKVELTQDVSCFNGEWNDQVSSLILIVGTLN